LVVDGVDRGVDVVDHGLDRTVGGVAVDGGGGGGDGADVRVGDHVGGGQVQHVIGGGVGADLAGQGGGVGTEDGLAVEGGAAEHAGDFLLQLGELLVQRVLVGGGVGGVAGLHGEFAHALQGVAHLGQRAFGGLGQRDAVVGVAHGDVHA